MTIFGISSKNELIQRILLKYLLQGTPLQEKENERKIIKMAEHTKNARPSTWDKHSDRDKGRKQDKIKGNSNWVDQGKRTNSSRNQAQKAENISKYNK